MYDIIDIMTYNEEFSFGIIPVIRAGESYKFLLIQHNAGHWSFPKGHAELGEAPLETAKREFTEETGIDNYDVIDNVTFSETYNLTREGICYKKTVVYFIAFVKGTDVVIQEDEVQNFKWASYYEALQAITFSESQNLLKKSMDFLSKSFTKV